MPPFLPNAGVSSGEINDYITTLSKRKTSHNLPISQLRERALSAQMPELAQMLAPRDEPGAKPVEPSRGIVNPSNINMQGLMALFALLGAAFVLAGIWFFFWAKNGGFIWRKGDWEEYKSTVLRRKDSQGRTLSDVTKSTDLGGGSVVGKGYGDYQSTVDAATTVGDSTVSGEKPRRKGIRETAKEKLLRKRKNEQWEGGGDEDMRAYRHEKPAKVGGLNREPDGEYHTSDYTTSNGQDSEWGQSQAQTHSHIGPLPGYEPDSRHSQRQRNVSGFSFTTGEDDNVTNATEEHRLRDSANPSSRHRDNSRHQHQRRSGRGSVDPHISARPRGPRASAPAPAPTTNRSRQSSPRKRERTAMPGGYTAPLDLSSHSSDYMYEQVGLTGESDTGTGTRSYHHPIPGLSKGYRRADGGGRGAAGRGRRDSLSESEGEDYDSRLS
ncbi:hypothetical protein ACJ72_08183 [Emergomyces africanus]|uniref:Uncharacterized protein n=1 Tax=Emergomyces africanus TaxID=1955775 RepID=A0A1B7NL60_9EURO|nr:hypothetical protein ACJ72_08183 [Emergomyces africanus]